MNSPKSRLAGLLALVLISGFGHSEEIDLKNADWLGEVAGTPTGNFGEIRPVKLTYFMTWKRTIKAATAEIVIDRSPDHPGLIIGTASGRSSGLAASLYPYQFLCHSRLDSDSLEPLSFRMEESTRRNRHLYQVDFQSDSLMTRKKSTSKKTNESSERQKAFQFGEKTVQDCFSVLLSGRRFPLNNHEKVTIIANPIDRPYLIRFTVLGRENRRLKGSNYRTIKLGLFIGRINDDATIKPFDKVSDATLWVIDDSERIPLELTADLFVGHFSAFLADKQYLRN